ncbi:hypothetical protein K431DRAFT_234700 [Polychaeton citri CBS 116435]|uniref:C2H2-type domain-containing protein n=1 Tax=Polychaeton citri CBS 116435 TaxID=1314669 RepID=A0A9P4PXG7_9PEZI|nr:hypothetical protein K431DRAFT_234700 [Polychaeton citri CBS 116435]
MATSDLATNPDTSDVAHATHNCLRCFEAILKQDDVTEGLCEAVEDLLARFRLWAGNIGAWHTKNDKRSADHRLRDATEILEWILELLEELLDTIDAVHGISSGQRPNKHVEDKDELTELCLTAGDIITGLMKVSMEVKKATNRDRYLNAVSAKQEPFSSEFDIRHVFDKFPKTKETVWLPQRLGAAITIRRQFLRYARDHHSRISSVAKLHVARQESFLAPSGLAQSSRPSQSPTAASTVQPNMIARKDVEALDRNDGAISETTSFVSSRPANLDKHCLDVIPLETLSKDNQPFECPYCFALLQAKRTRAWKSHVFCDLRAYVCTFEGCKVGLFESRESWFNHEMDAHRREWVCQNCPARVFASSKNLETHLRNDHDSNFSRLPSKALSLIAQASSRPMDQLAASACPLCDDWDADLRKEAESKGEPIPQQHEVLQSVKRFAQHLGGHQEQLALFAITSADVDDVAHSGSVKDDREDLRLSPIKVSRHMFGNGSE